MNGGVNTYTYAYVGGNPVMFVDPLGLQIANIPPESIPIKKFGPMLPCPASPPSLEDDKWVKYSGNPNAYHCGFNGFLEYRVPDYDNATSANECFYDPQGNLVDENHPYSGCRGTPDDYPVFRNCPSTWLNFIPHMLIDKGGPNGPSSTHSDLAEESKEESKRYFRENGGN